MVKRARRSRAGRSRGRSRKPRPAKVDPASVATPAPQLEKPAASSKPVSEPSTLSTAVDKKRSVKQSHSPAVKPSMARKDRLQAEMEKKRQEREVRVRTEEQTTRNRQRMLEEQRKEIEAQKKALNQVMKDHDLE